MRRATVSVLFLFLFPACGDTSHELPGVDGPVEPETVATGMIGARKLTLDAENAYVIADRPDLTLFATSIDGGNPTELDLVDGMTSECSPFASDGSFVYYLEQDQVTKVAVSGGEPAPVAAVTNALNECLALAGDSIFVEDDDWIRRIRVTDGSSEAIAETAGVYDFAIADGFLYWAEYGGLIQRWPLTGGAPQIVTGAIGDVRRIAVGGGFVYAFSGATGGDLYRIEGTGGSPVHVVSEDAYGLAADAHAAYWSVRASGPEDTIHWVAHEDIGAHELVTYAASPEDIAVDDRGVFWVSSSEGALRMVPK